MAKKFVRTTKTKWDNINDKSLYKDSIVFIEDAKLIWSNDVYYGESDIQNSIDITYSELVSLRDNSQLIPGMLYRITDYITTTTQVGTKSANNQFDIIVTADSENVLNENVRAIQHESENECYNETIYDGDKLTKDFFVEWGIFTEPNTEIDTLCIYKTDVAGLDPDSEDFSEDYESTDYVDVFFYKGNYEYNGESFDVWLKYESHNMGYQIMENYLYYLTAPIVENELIKPELYDADTLLFYEPFNAEYILSVDNSQIFDYFSNSNLNAWELKYTLDNDITRFGWADTENGKGVIYYMKDEFNNECPYDFKNIQFVRTSLWFSEHEDWCLDMPDYLLSHRDHYCYTFTYLNGNGEILDASIIGNTLYNDEGYITGVYGNVIKDCSSYSMYHEQSNSLFIIPDNVFYTTGYQDDYYGCCSNVFGNNCYSNTFADRCSHNTFGNNCYSNTFGRNFTFNIFENDCFFNTLGSECRHNTLKSGCVNNTFKNNCSYNLLENHCNENTFLSGFQNNIMGKYCLYNEFDAWCSYNTFGNDCCSNTFRDNCSYNTFGNNCRLNTLWRCFLYNTIGSDCRYMKLITTNGAALNRYRYYKFASGLRGVSENEMLEIKLTSNLEYETKVAKRTNGEIVIYNEADLVPWTYITE